MKRVLLMLLFAFLSCSSGSSVPGGYVGVLPIVEIITGTNEEGIVFRIYSDRDMRTLIRESKGDGSVLVEIPEGKYYFEAWKDMNGNGVIDTGDLYGADTTGSSIDTNCRPCQVYLNLSPIARR